MELLEYILIALACPLVLPFVDLLEECKEESEEA